jgi:signal transduction histidine kinase
MPANPTTESNQQVRLLAALERLLEIPTADLNLALSHSTDLVAKALAADKVDAFLYQPARDSLVALGSSSQPLSAAQRRHGLDILPIANGGRVVQVYLTGKTFVTGHLEQDPEELLGIRETLKIRSEIGVPLEVGGTVRGMLMIASLQPDFFGSDDVRLAESVARWVGIVAHRAELAEQIARNSLEEGRRAGAEELVTVLAHDLRNYLSPLKLRLDALLRRAERERRERDRADLELALKGLARLSGMVSDILDVARVEQGMFQINVQPVDLVALVEETARVLATPEQPVTVKASEPATVAADAGRARQCVENLLANAVKHSPAGAAVTVLIRRERGDRRELARVDVLDEGPGIPADVLPRIFGRFVTGDGLDGGLGLGLYLAKQIALLHEGDLQVASVPGKGARFTLILPCYDEGA